MLNKDVIDMYEGLAELASDRTARLPAKVSFAVMRNLRALQPIVEDIESTRAYIISSHGGIPVGEHQMQIEHDKIDECSKDLENLAGVDVDVSLAKIKFADIENLNLSIPMAQAFEFMLEEEA